MARKKLRGAGLRSLIPFAVFVYVGEGLLQLVHGNFAVPTDAAGLAPVAVGEVDGVFDNFQHEYRMPVIEIAYHIAGLQGIDSGFLGDPGGIP